MEPTDALFNVVEASLALAGFAGIVTALGQRSAGHWRPDDRDRIVNLLVATLFPFASSLLAVTLIYARVASVWRVSSGALALFVLFAATFAGRRVARSAVPISASYLALVYLALTAALVLQLANLLRFNSFWPYFAGIALLLCIGVSQFVRLLWFGIQGGRAAS